MTMTPQPPLYIVLLLILTSVSLTKAQQQQDPTTLNGGSVLAMAGKDSVALAVDKRFGSGPQVRIKNYIIFVMK
jgi:20S proteasome alpha/beta subunit